MYIRSSPRGPNRDPDRTLSNELLLLYIYYLVTVLTKLNSMPLKAQVTPLKVPVTTQSIAATTLGLGGDTSIKDMDLQLVIVGQL